MSKPMLLEEFTRLPPALTVDCVDGLSGAIDAVATRAAPSHRFLRYGWFAAGLRAYGGHARTITVSREGEPVAALPIVPAGPAWAKLVAIPGCYWPFRSFPVREDAGVEAVEALLPRLAREARALRVGPVYDGDPGLELFKEAARNQGWALLDRFVADSFALDIAAERAEGTWPRNSTLKKNRFHEKHLGSHGALDWSFVSGGDWNAAAFDALAEIEEKSWIAARTDGSDAKFTTTGHGAFWRAAAEDPVLAGMMWAAMLRVDDAPSAFSFDMNAGALKYAIANSYDPAFAKHSPGKLLYYRNLVRAIEDGISDVDWGAGDSGYKQVIGAAKGPAIRDWLFVRPGIDALAGKLLRGAWKRTGRSETGSAPAEAERVLDAEKGDDAREKREGADD
ncbi:MULTISPECIES: GNAT family N-acetyltransferase [Sphingomonas]|uniref:CelD/BcsL family acetyltransferase involved in cellulose biosynthesis n=1 Tax=Sphingomonas kyeonggiensis TaxID=1268553 RepID=A0A7W7NR05_9SPHN|nr:GNAT family N-acetyltransferase [Sphingomonas kyeonggiensis]MBB4837241.1 CelD/BcsL family acetyltransferase involved in cellulose biosynthesis [Sphingomonas kyeonggiensis]